MVICPKTARREKGAGFVNDSIPRPFTVTTESGEEITCDKGDPNQMTNSAACFMNGQSKSQANSMIVPVWLSHGRNLGTEQLVYALLDDQSDTTFIADTILNHLGVSGPEKNFVVIDNACHRRAD